MMELTIGIRHYLSDFIFKDSVVEFINTYSNIHINIKLYSKLDIKKFEDKYYEGYMAGVDARLDYDIKCQDDDNRNWCDDHWISYPDENEIDPPDWDGICAQ